MEENKSGDMSDKDRKMAESFEFKDDKSDEKDDKKSEKKSGDTSETKKDGDERKIPRRSLFFGRGEGDGEKKEPEGDGKQEKAGLFAGILKQDVETEPKIEKAEPEQSVEAGEADEQLQADFQEVVVDRLQAVEEELELPEVPDPAAVEADAEFLEHVGDRLSEGMEPEQAIEDALEDENDPPEADASAADLQNEAFFEDEPEEEEPLPPVPPSPPAPPTPPRPPSPPSPPPPIPPIPPQGPNLPPNPGNPNTQPSAPNASPQNPNVINNPNVVPMNDTYYRRRRSGDLLLGGALGYLLGRRRGRRRAEAELMPEIKKRDEKLEGLRTKLETSEAEVRAMAAEKVPVPPVETRTERIVEEVPVVEKVVETIEAAAPTIEVEKTIVEQQEQAFEQQIDAQAAAERELPSEVTATELIEKEVPVVEKVVETVEAEEGDRERAEQEPEQIGAIVERLMPQAVPAAEKVAEVRSERIEPKKDPQTMTMPELLEVAEHINLDKTSLRELYERKRIDAVNLRRVILEYFKGGSRYEKILRGSLEAVEMQRELRGETRQDADFKARIQTSGGGSLPGSRPGGGTGDMQARRNKTAELGDRGQVTTIFNEQEDDRLLVSNGTAIVVGVLAGIVIMVLLILYSNW